MGFTIDLYRNDIDTSYGWNGGIGKNRCGAHWAEYYIRDKLKPLSTGFSSNVSVPDLIERYHWNKSGDVRSKDGLRKAPYFGDFVNHYAGIIYDANNFTFVASGYYRPTRSGQYTFCANVDDAENFWFGSDNAFPCGQATNDEFRTGMTPRIYTVYVRNWPPEARKTECWETTLKAGYYYPFRSVMGNWAGASRMTFMVKRPDNSGYVTDVEGEAFPKTC